MSTDFRLEKRVLIRELFDGKLQQYGIVEEIAPYQASKHNPVRALIDGRGNTLVVYANDYGYVCCLSRYGDSSPECILQALAAAFNTGIYSEHQPQYWGFNTEEEYAVWMESQR